MVVHHIDVNLDPLVVEGLHQGLELAGWQISEAFSNSLPRKLGVAITSRLAPGVILQSLALTFYGKGHILT
jgi:predicted heme/steroid binding protein